MNYFVILFSYTSEILEIQADAPSLHVLFVPGNPGVASICFSARLYWRFQDLFSNMWIESYYEYSDTLLIKVCHFK